MCSLDLVVNPSLSFLWTKWGQIFWRERTVVEGFEERVKEKEETRMNKKLIEML